MEVREREEFCAAEISRQENHARCNTLSTTK